MLAAVATVLGLMACVIALAAVGQRSRIPYPTLMVIAGLCIGVIPNLPQIKLNPDVVFLIFLPPILYGAAWNTWWEEFKRNIRTISLLAIGLVLFTTAGVGVVAHAVIPGMSWSSAFLLGAIVSPPDAAAATAICQRLGVSRKIVAILEGESLVNDATGIICYRFALAAIASGDFSFANAGVDLLIAGGGGLLLGILTGWIISHIHQRLRDPAISTAISLLAPFLAYLPAELLHVSGVLATVTAGLLVSRRSPQIFSPQARLQAVHVWDLLILLLNGLVFVLIGVQLNSVVEGVSDYSVATLVWYAVAICLATILTRLIWVFPISRISRIVAGWVTGKREPYPSWAATTVVGWTGMRNRSLAAALALPTTTPLRDLTILITFAVIFATLVLQSLTLPPMIRSFGESVSKEGEHEELIARLMTASAAIQHLDQLVAQPGDTRRADAASRIRIAYMNRVDYTTNALGGVADAPESATTFEIIADGRATPDDPIRLEAIAAERAALIDLRDKGEISEESFRRIERDLDLEETRLV